MTAATIAESAESLRLSNRALRVLRRADVTTVDALAKLSDWEISDLPSAGPVTALEIASARNLAAGLADAEGVNGSALAAQLARIADALEAMVAAGALDSATTPPPPASAVAEYMTTAEAAKALGVVPRTIANMLDRGDLTRHKFGPRGVRLLRSEVYSAIRPEVTR